MTAVPELHGPGPPSSASLRPSRASRGLAEWQRIAPEPNRPIWFFWAPACESGRLVDAAWDQQERAICAAVAPSPLVARKGRWAVRLRAHPDRALVDWFLYHLSTGFLLGSSAAQREPERSSKPNNVSSSAQPEVLDAWIAAELSAGRVAGPFGECPWSQGVTLTPLGLAEKSAPPGHAPKFRTTTDHTRSGLNASIHEDTASISYVDVRDVAADWAELPASSYGFVLDVADAYRIIPTAPVEWQRCAFTWRQKFYVDTRLSFGVASGPVLFDALGRLLEWAVLAALGPGSRIWRLLDDSAMILDSEAQACAAQAAMLLVYEDLGVPVQRAKLLQPSPVFKFLGFMWDFRNQGSISIPTGKCEKATLRLRAMLEAGRARLSDLEALCGLLNWMTLVARMGRCYLRALYDLSTRLVRAAAGSRRLAPQPPRLTCLWVLAKGAETQVAWWLQGLSADASDSNGATAGQRLMLSAPFRWFRRNLHADVFVNTDASGDGFGGWSGEDWFAGEWPGAWRP